MRNVLMGLVGATAFAVLVAHSACGEVKDRELDAAPPGGDGDSDADTPDIDSGLPASCEKAEDCGTDSFCQTFSCVDGECEGEYTAEDEPLPEDQQVDGNCVELQCDGEGNAIPVDDDEDVPEEDPDPDDCTVPVCVNGEPDTAPVGKDEECSTDGGRRCDGEGSCVECNVPSHCSISAGQCQEVVCANHECDLRNKEPNTSCNDGVFCNGADTCNASGECAVHAGDPCDGPDSDGDCSETCRETQNDCNGNDPEGRPCNDGLFCTGTDTCDGQGQCTGSLNNCPGLCCEACNCCGGCDGPSSCCP